MGIKSNIRDGDVATVSPQDYIEINDRESGKVGFVTVGDLLGSSSAAKFDHRNRKIFTAERKSDWTVVAVGGSVTEALDTDSYFAGGNVITMTQTDTANTLINTLTSPIPFYVPSLGQTTPWFATCEMAVSSGQFASIVARDTGSTDLWYVQIGLPNHTITCKAPGAADLVVAPTNFNQARDFRIMVVTTPATAITGTIRYFLYYKDTSSGAPVHQFLGSQSYSSNVVASRFIITEGWVATGTVKVARFKSYELLGVMNGCSLDAGYVGWAPDPDTGRNFSPATYNQDRNPALLLSKNLNADGDWIVNHARGGALVQEMYDNFATHVLALNPKLIVLGSATNSLVSALQFTGATRETYIATAKSQYLSMAQQALASGAVVLAQGITPRHDPAPLAALAEFKAMALDWNAWMKVTLSGVKVNDIYAALEDPAAPGHLVAWADAGDNVHFSRTAQQLQADRQYQALIS